MLGLCAIVFVACAAMTIAASASMSAMGVMQMPGGWTMSHMWVVMPGQSWLGAMASFVAMWAVMMVAMMLPSLVPSLLRYRASFGANVSATRAGWLVVVVGVAYFAIWTLVGVVVFALGAAFANSAMNESSVARSVPLLATTSVLVGGIVQVWMWRSRYASLCRDTSSMGLETRVSVRTAWRHGVCLGLHCVRSCAGITIIALCLGVMDLRVMATVTVLVTVERRWHVFGRFLA
jgi:predicted metal-binding membrane protein